MSFPAKEDWGPGPWQDEPDRVEGRYKGFPVLLRRADLGHWCGYVAVPPGHPWHGVDGNDVEAHVHGGITYSGSCDGEICHVPKPGEPDDVWWIGFDAAHAWDCCPAMGAMLRKTGAPFGILDDPANYKPLPYIREQVEHLAEQAAAAVSE